MTADMWDEETLRSLGWDPVDVPDLWREVIEWSFRAGVEYMGAATVDAIHEARHAGRALGVSDVLAAAEQLKAKPVVIAKRIEGVKPA